MSTSEPGVTLHFLADGLTVHTGAGYRSESQVMRRGQTLLVTPEVREANTDRLGQCSLDLTEAEQLARWRVVYFRPGPFPDDEDPLTIGSFEHDQARANALKQAAEIADPDEQRIALARVREKYGVPSSGRSRTLMEYER